MTWPTKRGDIRACPRCYVRSDAYEFVNLTRGKQQRLVCVNCYDRAQSRIKKS